MESHVRGRLGETCVRGWIAACEGQGEGEGEGGEDGEGLGWEGGWREEWGGLDWRVGVWGRCG